MHPAFESVRLQSEVNIPTPPVVDIVLVEHVIQALIQVLQVEQDDCSSCLHTDLNLVNVATHLKKRKTILIFDIKSRPFFWKGEFSLLKIMRLKTV